MIRELTVFVPSNRVDRHGKLTHMDGWNEIIKAYKAGVHAGAARERENVRHVADYVHAAMIEQGWPHMTSPASAQPCSVELTFVESSRRRDIGNIHGGAKYALDALTARNKFGAGAIYDDSQTWMPKVTYSVALDRNKPGLRILVRFFISEELQRIKF